MVQEFVGIHSPHITVPMWLAEGFATSRNRFTG
jgi:hypothetical protein